MKTPLRASSLVRSIEAENDSLRYRVKELETELRALKHVLKLPADIERPFGLTPSENIIFTLLMAREFVSRETMVTALYGDRSGFEPNVKVIEAFIVKIRRKLFPRGSVKNDYGVGWFIPREMKVRVRDFLSTRETTNDCTTASFDTASKPVASRNGANGTDRSGSSRRQIRQACGGDDLRHRAGPPRA